MRMLLQTCKWLKPREIASCRIALRRADLERLWTIDVLSESKWEIALLYKGEFEIADILTAGRLVNFLASGGSGRNFGF